VENKKGEPKFALFAGLAILAADPVARRSRAALALEEWGRTPPGVTDKVASRILARPIAFVAP